MFVYCFYRSSTSYSSLRKVVDEGEDLTEDNAFDPNLRTAEREVSREKLRGFVLDFLGRLTALDGENSSLSVFCRVDMSVFVDDHRRVSLFVNEVERGITTCLWAGSGPSAVGHIGSELAWALALWIIEERKRLGVC